MKTLLFAVLALVIPYSPLWPLDVVQGRIKLTLYDGMGRFSLSYISNPGKTYTPLLYSKDPRTTSTSLVIGNKVYRFGDTAEFRESVEKTEQGARFVWTSSMLVVSQEFSFLSSTESSEADGLRIDLDMKNVSTQNVSVGVRYILDTYLGEPSYVHFKTDKLPELNHELTLTKADKPLYIVSPLVGDQMQLGFMCMLSGDGITIPDRVVFANWKRLNDASWSYDTAATRNFNLLPYSVNDSAVSLYFDPQQLSPGAERRIVTVVGNYSPSGFSIAESAASAQIQAPAAQTPSQTTPTETTPIPVAEDTVRIEESLKGLEALLESINEKLKSGQTITDEEIAKMTEALAKFKENPTTSPEGPNTNPGK